MEEKTEHLRCNGQTLGVWFSALIAVCSILVGRGMIKPRKFNSRSLKEFILKHLQICVTADGEGTDFKENYVKMNKYLERRKYSVCVSIALENIF